jgi:hypothetical protein
MIESWMIFWAVAGALFILGLVYLQREKPRDRDSVRGHAPFAAGYYAGYESSHQPGDGGDGGSAGGDGGGGGGE